MLSPAYGHTGTDMHATVAGPPNSTATALCGLAYVIRSQGDYVAAASSRGPLATYCPACLSAAIESLRAVDAPSTPH